MVLLKTFDGTLSGCDRFILKIFFYRVKRICRNHFKQISDFLILFDIPLMYGGRLLKILIYSPLVYSKICYGLIKIIELQLYFQYDSLNWK